MSPGESADSACARFTRRDRARARPKRRPPDCAVPVLEPAASTLPDVPTATPPPRIGHDPADRVDQYGRLLRKVVRLRDGVNLNIRLVAVGAAAPYFYRHRRANMRAGWKL
jgi:hypothetical protein